nr:hypothetical protein [Streptococcus pneumoniae]
METRKWYVVLLQYGWFNGNRLATK